MDKALSNVVRLHPRKRHFRGHAREALTQSLDAAKPPVATIIVTLGKDGSFSLRSVQDKGQIHSFDMYSRAAAILNKEAQSYLEMR